MAHSKCQLTQLLVDSFSRSHQQTGSNPQPPSGILGPSHIYYFRAYSLSSIMNHIAPRAHPSPNPMPFHPPSEAEIRSCRELAKHHQQAAQRSGRA